MVSLPTLPTPACTTYFDVECVEVATRFYKAEQMQAYGQQCRDAALEEAAVGLETGDVSTFKDDAYMLAYTTHLLIYFAKYFRSLK